MSISIVGIDIAKNIFHLHGVTASGRTEMKERVSRSELTTKLATLRPCRVVMEACGGSNHWAREAAKYGHTVDLIAPQYVKPFVLRNKNDWKDAEAITIIAARQPTMRYVPKRTTDQQDIQNIRRIRERLVKARTALINEARGLLHEYGIVIPQGRRSFEKCFREVLVKHASQLSRLALETFDDLWTEYNAVHVRVLKHERTMERISKKHPVCERLMGIPGVGFLTATAVLASMRDASVFRNGREFAAWLGITPKEYSTGGKQRLGGISKRGDKYIRKLLIHGARVTLRYLHRYNDQRSRWAQNLLQKKGVNRSAVAVANKNARTIWALLTRDEEYKSMPLAA